MPSDISPPPGTPDPAAPRGRSMARWLRVLLFSSLALNLVFAGLIAGAVLGHGGERGRSAGPGAAPGGVALAYVRALERDDRRALFRDLRDDPQGAGAAGPRVAAAEARSRAEALTRVLRAPELSPDALEAALTLHAEAASARLTRVHDGLARRIQEMSADERAAYADRIEAELDRPARARTAR